MTNPETHDKQLDQAPFSRKTNNFYGEITNALLVDCRTAPNALLSDRNLRYGRKTSTLPRQVLQLAPLKTKSGLNYK